MSYMLKSAQTPMPRAWRFLVCGEQQEEVMEVFFLSSTDDTLFLPEPDLFFRAQRRGVMISLSCVSWRFRPGRISLPCVSCQSPTGARGVVALEGFLGTLVVLPEMHRGGWFQSGFFGGIFQAKGRKSFIWRISYFCEEIS